MGYKGLLAFTGGYRGFKGLQWVQGVAVGYKGLQGVAGCYKGLQEVRGGDQEVPGVTKFYMWLQRVTGG